MSIHTEAFSARLPVGPLTQHIKSLHSAAMFLGAKGDVKDVVENHLRAIAVYTRHAPGMPPGSAEIRKVLCDKFPEWDGSLDHLKFLLTGEK